MAREISQYLAASLASLALKDGHEDWNQARIESWSQGCSGGTTSVMTRMAIMIHYVQEVVLGVQNNAIHCYAM